MVRRHRHRRGQTLVEFALALPLFIVILFGLFDLGRAVYAYNTISNAARVGNRVAIVDQTPSNVRTATKDEAVAVGLTDGDITITQDCAQIGCLVHIQVITTFVAAVPLIGAIVGPIEMKATSDMPIERIWP